MKLFTFSTADVIVSDPCATGVIDLTFAPYNEAGYPTPPASLTISEDSSNTMSVLMTDPAEAGEVHIKITASLGTFTPISMEMRLKAVVLTFSLPNEVVYTTQAEPIVMTFAQNVTFDAGSDTSPYPQLSDIVYTGTSNAPSFITVENANTTASINTTVESDVGEYSLQVRAWYGNYGVNSNLVAGITTNPSYVLGNFVLKILSGCPEDLDKALELIAPLQFKTPLDSVFEIDISQTWEYTLPDTIEPDIEGSENAACFTIPDGGYEVDIEVIARGPVKFDSRNKKFILHGALAEADIGNYTQTINLSDNISNNTAEFTFKLEISNITV